ncbi:hypothetical protein GW17_00054362 [Ensete ventricosum]|nr:hypothetical protein GW17_00054362 [Ensete ventricosum]
MHPLMFPKSGIRAKATRRRDSQPRPTPMQGWPPMARSASWGSRLRPRPPWPWLASARTAPAGVGSALGPAARGSRLQPGRKGQPPTARP